VRRQLQIKVTEPAGFAQKRYAGFLKLMGYKEVPSDVPLTYPIVEAFRLAMLSMSHPDFPFNVLGAVLARNSVYVSRPLTAMDKLVHR
jgi:hypothetical protein